MSSLGKHDSNSHHNSNVDSSHNHDSSTSRV